MNEFEFRQKLHEWQIDVKGAMLPTSAEVLLYGQRHKTRIISEIHEHAIYGNIKPLEITDELYHRLQDTMKLDDRQILKFIHKGYIQYLRDIRKKIVELQKSWSRNYCQFRAKQVIAALRYDDIYHICDLADQRIVPIELVLKLVFNVNSFYGEFRRVKDKSEIFVDPRVLQTFKYIKDNKLNLPV